MVIMAPPSGSEGQLRRPPSPASDTASLAESGVTATSGWVESPAAASATEEPPEPPLPAEPPAAGAALSSPEHAASPRKVKQRAWVRSRVKDVMLISEA